MQSPLRYISVYHELATATLRGFPVRKESRSLFESLMIVPSLGGLSRLIIPMAAEPSRFSNEEVPLAT
jgi:hypothetical protein